jgi:hypothetical protein
MVSFTIVNIMEQIDKLIDEYSALRKRSNYDDISDLKDESSAFVVRLRAAIERLAPASSTYVKEMNAIASDKNNSTAFRIRAYVGILQALRADADEAWLQGVSELLHADTLADFIDQADELASKGYDNAAVVIAGSALEAHLRLLCGKNGINVELDSSRRMKADAMNAELVRSGVYNSLQQKAITSWQAIQNAAAHGEYDKYSKEQALTMISSVRDFILMYPA